MEKDLYECMDWPAIEAVTYGEMDHPEQLLGSLETAFGVLYSVYWPEAVSMELMLTKEDAVVPMERVDEGGFFSVLLTGKKRKPHEFRATREDGSQIILPECYDYESLLTPEDERQFQAGVHYDIYQKLGAHKLTRDGVDGVSFAVWAPNAVAVGVACNYNHWDSRVYPMIRHDESGIFELFVPGLSEGEVYKYEIRHNGGASTLKSDPYGFYAELRPATASIVYDMNQFSWSDSEWMKTREKQIKTQKQQPMAIYEMHLGSWRCPESASKEADSDIAENAFYNYRTIAEQLIPYLKQMGYTHVEFMPLMEHPLDASWGYQVTGYYAATSRYGTPDDLRYLINELHANGIGVILDWVPAHFPRDMHGLASFDGTCLYEHKDPRQGAHPQWGTLIYNYKRPQVSNFLIANAMFWVEQYHIDGLRLDAVASMLYLDYGKRDGEWVANLYGGNENLDAVEFLKHLNSMMKKRNPGVYMIAEESTAWPMVTGEVKKDGLGFDYKWNMGWMNDFLDYMRTDPLFRKGKHGELTFSMVYHYSENFILVLSHDEVVHGKGSMIEKMPGEYEQKFANLRVAYGFMMAHPGKKLLFMGQEFAQFAEWDENHELDWKLPSEFDSHRLMQQYVADLLAMYQKHPALYAMDYDPQGFEWLSTLDADHSTVSFLRRSENEELLVVCNFTPVAQKDFKIGVPYEGKYKEIFNSDAEIYGGEGQVNKRVKRSKAQSWDGRKNSITAILPPMGVSVYQCMRLEDTR